MDYSHLLQESGQANTDAVSVADFIGEINKKLAQQKYRIRGEVTSINKSYGKAVYFSVKDIVKDAKLDCVIWKSVYDQNSVDVRVGDEIIITGNPEIYAPQGRFSLKVTTIEYAGEGILKKTYDALKKKLEEEGLFERERKKIPRYPQKIGIITSLSGVVIHDFTTNLERRGYSLQVIDSRVEGKDALHDIQASLNTFKKKDIDLLVIMRGGGSWESLQAFNTESVVRAIAKFPIPILTGIGHDVDVTLAELIADKGVSTPTAVAKTLNEPWKILENYLQNAEVKTYGRYEQTLLSVKRDLQKGLDKIMSMYRLGFMKKEKIFNQDLASVIRFFHTIHKKAEVFEDLFQKIFHTMKYHLRSTNTQIHQRILFLQQYIKRIQENTQKTLERDQKTIESYNPENTLKRGYSILYKGDTIIRTIKDVQEGDELSVRVSDGKIHSTINNIT